MPRVASRKEGQPDLSTRERLLNSAEALFAQASYDAVSIRDIADHAQCRLGLVNYYFRSKEQMFEQVIARRFETLDVERQRRLAELRSRPGMTVEDLLRAMMEPFYEFLVSGDEGWQNYGLLVAQTAQTNRWTEMMHRFFDPTALDFYEALRKLFPKSDPELAMRAFLFALQSMISAFAQSRRADYMSGHKISGTDLPAVYRALLTYATGGLVAVLQAPAARPARRTAARPAAKSKTRARPSAARPARRTPRS
jgi:AcrR family transcriptional regulator